MELPISEFEKPPSVGDTFPMYSAMEPVDNEQRIAIWTGTVTAIADGVVTLEDISK